MLSASLNKTFLSLSLTLLHSTHTPSLYTHSFTLHALLHSTRTPSLYTHAFVLHTYHVSYRRGLRDTGGHVVRRTGRRRLVHVLHVDVDVDGVGQQTAVGRGDGERVRRRHLVVQLVLVAHDPRVRVNDEIGVRVAG